MNRQPTPPTIANMIFSCYVWQGMTLGQLKTLRDDYAAYYGIPTELITARLSIVRYGEQGKTGLKLDIGSLCPSSKNLEVII